MLKNLSKPLKIVGVLVKKDTLRCGYLFQQMRNSYLPRPQHIGSMPSIRYAFLFSTQKDKISPTPTSDKQASNTNSNKQTSSTNNNKKKQQQSFWKRIEIYLNNHPGQLILGLITFFTGTILLSIFTVVTIQNKNDREFLEKYSQSFVLPDSYTSTSMEETLEKQLREFKSERGKNIKFVVGNTGIGKSTAFKAVINKLRGETREDGKTWKIIYFSIKKEEQEGSKVHQQNWTELINLFQILQRDQTTYFQRMWFTNLDKISKYLGLTTTPNNIYTVVLDGYDFLKRQKFPRGKLEYLEDRIKVFCQPEKSNVFFISNSSIPKKSLDNHVVLKSVFSMRIFKPSQLDTEKVLRSMLYKSFQLTKPVNETASTEKQKTMHVENVVKNAIAENCSFQFMETFINLSKQSNFNISEIENKYKQYADKYVKDTKNSINKIFSQNLMGRQEDEIQKTKKKVIQLILGLEKTVNIGDQDKIIDAFLNTESHSQVKKIVSELDGQNILSYGHPKSKLEEKALELNLIKESEQTQKKSGQKTK